MRRTLRPFRNYTQKTTTLFRPLASRPLSSRPLHSSFKFDAEINKTNKLASSSLLPAFSMFGSPVRSFWGKLWARKKSHDPKKETLARKNPINEGTSSFLSRISPIQMVKNIFAGRDIIINIINHPVSLRSDSSLEANEFFSQGVTEYENRNYEQAYFYFKKADECGLFEAAYNLGVMNLQGQSVSKNPKEAVKYFERAAEKGVPQAQCALGMCYFTGEGAEQDQEKAIEYFKQAAAQEFALAQYMLGECYFYGEGVEKNFREAVVYFKQAAAQGDAKAQFMLGILYLQGKTGIEKNEEEAMMYLKQYAAQEDNVDLNSRRNTVSMMRVMDRHGATVRDMELLGILYLQGKGIEKNEEKAMMYLKQYAAQEDNVDLNSRRNTLSMMRVMDRHGGERCEKLVEQRLDSVGPPSQVVKNIRAGGKVDLQLKQSENMPEVGNTQEKTKNIERELQSPSPLLVSSKYQIIRFKTWLDSSAAAVDYPSWVAYFEQAAAQGMVKAQYAAGACYFDGVGVVKDTMRGVQYFKQAADQGDEDAISALEEIQKEKEKNANDLESSSSSPRFGG